MSVSSDFIFPIRRSFSCCRVQLCLERIARYPFRCYNSVGPLEKSFTTFGFWSESRFPLSPVSDNFLTCLSVVSPFSLGILMSAMKSVSYFDTLSSCWFVSSRFCNLQLQVLLLSKPSPFESGVRLSSGL